MNKTTVRQLVKKTRFNRTLKEINKLNTLIKKNLLSFFDFSQYNHTFVYLSCSEKGEVDTWNIIPFLKNNIYVPTIDSSNNMYVTKSDLDRMRIRDYYIS